MFKEISLLSKTGVATLFHFDIHHLTLVMEYVHFKLLCLIVPSLGYYFEWLELWVFKKNKYITPSSWCIDACVILTQAGTIKNHKKPLLMHAAMFWLYVL